MKQTGKDGKEFNLARYIDWVKTGRPSLLKFQKFKRQKKVNKWFCPNCFNGPFSGLGI